MEQSNNIVAPKKSNRFIKFIKRIFFTIIIGIFAITSISVFLIYFYEDELKNLVIKELNKHLKAEVRLDPKNIDLTILKSFPNCSIEFKEITTIDSKEFKGNDTLFYANRFALQFNIKDLFHKKYRIKRIEIEKAKCFLKVNKNGSANYFIWKSNDNEQRNDSLTFALESISVMDVELNYKNSKAKIKLQTHIESIDFKGEFSTDNYVLKSIGKVYINNFQVKKVNYVENKHVNFDLELQVTGNNYVITKSETRINETKLVSRGNFVVKDSLISLEVDFNGNNLDISSSLSLLPEKFQAQIEDYESEGEFYATGNLRYQIGKPFVLKSQFGIKQAVITYKPKNTTLSNVNLFGSIDMNGKYSLLKLQSITANLNNDSISGEVALSHFENPYLTLKIKANSNLEELINFYPIDTIQELHGKINLNATIEGLISELKSNAYSPSIIANGTADVKDLKVKFKQSESEISIPEAKIKLVERHLNVYYLKLLKGNSDIILVGEIPKFLSYLFDNKEPLQITASIESENLYLEDLIFPSTQSHSNSEVVIPANLILNVNTNIRHFYFKKFTAQDIKGNVLLKDQRIALNNLELNTNGGTIKSSVFADASGENIVISGECNLEKLNIQTLFTQLNNFGQTTIQDQHLRGFITSTVNFTTIWDKALKVDLNSIKATSSILIERGELLGFKPLESLAKYIDVNELKHIKFSTLQSTLDIKNKSISIPRTSIQSSVLNLELWGKHTFDNYIDYHIQLLLSELLAKKERNNKNLDDELSLIENDPENRRSVFIVMTGPIENPIIKYDRKGAKEKIKEDLKQEKQTIKNILREEFGWFNKDTNTVNKNNNKADQKFQIKTDDANKKMPSKKQEDDDDF